MRPLIALFVACLCYGQQPEFEVASIKPSPPEARGSNFNRKPGGGLDALNVTLKEMILFSYNIREQQLIGATGWMENEHYDVMAKPSLNDNPTNAKRSFEADINPLQLKLRAVLADRFKLAVHNEARELPVYFLVPAKGGTKLTPSTSEDLRINNRNGLVICRKCTMKQVAESTLTYKTGRTVIDKTGLNGEYDFDLKYLEDAAIAAGDTSAPDLLTALRQQLGLVLESAKAPVEVLVIDHAEKATLN
jgi:uncharacterized protein (TIGR03435 family)